jgi:hypothetical protein
LGLAAGKLYLAGEARVGRCGQVQYAEPLGLEALRKKERRCIFLFRFICFTS